MPQPHASRTRPAVLALALGAARAGACKPGGDYGYDRVSHREYPPPVPQADFPDPPAPRASLLAGGGQKVTLANAPAGVTQAMVDEGQELFANPCVGCHGTGGAGSPSAPPLDDAQWLNISGAYPEIVQVIANGVASPKEYPGVMLPKGGRGDLTDAQVRALAAYVYALSHQGSQ